MRRPATRPVLAATVLGLAVSLTACAGQQRPEPIPDTPDAQAVLSVLQTYREAMENLDVDTILSLASKDYADPMGTPDADDDLTYEDLRTKLEKDFADVRTLRLDLDVTRMDFGPKNETVQVTYRYDMRYQLALPSGDKWHNALDVNRMVLRREDDGWKVISGL